MPGSYSHEEVRDLINVQVLSIRLETIEKRNEENWTSFKEHIANEDKVINDIYKELNNISKNISGGDKNIQACRDDLENKIRANYPTKDQLNLALKELGEVISTNLGNKFDSFATRMEAKIAANENSTNDKIKTIQTDVAANKNTINKYMYIGTGIIITVTIILNGIKYIEGLIK